MLLLFFDISGGELLIILAAVFLVFGPKKVPEIARQIGKGMNELKKATSDITREFQEGANQAQKEVNQVKNTIEVSNQRMNNEFLTGPADFKEDKAEPPAEEKPSVAEEKTEPAPPLPEGAIPGDKASQ
ncbi:MAG: twin-arginine translocase TatA/TatE family subunit [Bacteroidales bacterium]